MKKIFCTWSLGLLLCFSFIPPVSAAQFFFLDDDMAGKPVPDFTLKTTQGKTVNLKEFRDNKKSIVFFWATWCPHCRETLSDLSKRKEEIEKTDIKFALVDIGESQKVVQSYLDKHKIPYDVFLDEEETLAEPYNIIGVPTFVFVDEKGNVKEILHSFPKNFQKVFEPS